MALYTEEQQQNIASNINSLRNELGKTLEEFGELFDAGKSNVSKWEKGLSVPNIKRLNEMAYVADVTVYEFINESIFGENMKQKDVITADQAFEYKKQVDRMQEFYEMMHELSVLAKIPLILGIVDDKNHTVEIKSDLLHRVSHAIKDVLDGQGPDKAMHSVFNIEDIGE